MDKKTKSASRTSRAKNRASEGKPSPSKGGASDSIRAFPVIGIGASAGGLETLSLFLANVPKDSGAAYVIVQHLDPTHKDLMVELLQRNTSMQVFQARDRLRIKPDCVYVIPPNKDMSILRGVLHLLAPLSPRGLRLPIDYFFRALADDQQERSIGVILSGMGSDGTLGLRAIKERAGATFVQEPATAKFDSMPRHAIEAGLADVIAPVEALPARIAAYLRHEPLVTNVGSADHVRFQSALDKVMILLRSQTGQDFSLYKDSTVCRRIERRMGLHNLDKIANYVRLLQENPQEVDLLFHELLIGVTRFFRDPEAWKQLKTDTMVPLLAGRTAKPSLRAWVPACATGEEAYSLAILFKETLEETKADRNTTLQIFATDLDQHAIEKARDGLFPANIIADVSPARLDRFFVKVDGEYQVAKAIREMVVFAQHNVIMDSPFSKLDILSCRNCLIYLSPELQQKLLPVFHYSLNPGGFLFLGSAETVGTASDLFAALPGKARLYRRLEQGMRTAARGVPLVGMARSRTPSKPREASGNLQALADQVLLQTYSPAAVLTNDRGDILYINGRTGKYLEPAAGKANWNIFAMARGGLRGALTIAFGKALREKKTTTVKNVVVSANATEHVMNVTLHPINEESVLNGTILIVFADVEAQAKNRVVVKPGRETPRSKALERELEHARQEMEGIREEMQTIDAEREAANEELQSRNEELQATNEELITSKEELQSMNEELHTMNRQLQIGMDEISRTNNDMKNLLDSTDIATLFLDNDLTVRRFTSETGKVSRLIPGDVGRPITDIASALLYPELPDDAREVLRSLTTREREIATADGHWFSVRILPYRTLDNVLDGVVVTFVDIDTAKKLEAELRATEARLRDLLGQK
jgi:chemotaxis methyl-accepting protein methylase